MKIIQKYLVICFFTYWIGYITLRFIFKTTQWQGPDFFNATLLGFFMAILFTGAIYGGLYFTIVPKIRYVESRDLKIPYYNDRQERIVTPTKDNFSFSELQNKISQNWILTYVDDELKIIKFRTKDTIFHWGVGSYLAYDDAINYVRIVSFPFTGYTQKDKQLKAELNNQIEALILNA
jgi:predicted secreted acid phosphatase